MHTVANSYITIFSHLFCLTHQFITVLFIFLLEMTQHLEIVSHLHYVITIVLVYK